MIEKDQVLSGIGLISNAGARFEAPETISGQGRFEDVTKRAGLEMNPMDTKTLGVAALDYDVAAQTLTCTECGRCQSQCPAWATGKPLSPKLLITGLRDHAYAKAPYLLAGGGKDLTGEEDRAFWEWAIVETLRHSGIRIEELCQLTKFPNSALDRYPLELSGGQRQRVSLMRALMLSPELLLLDEPFAALDPFVRVNLQRDLKEICARLQQTVLLVTHDLAEAAFLGDEIALMNEGRIVQRGSIADLRAKPANQFVREFISAQRGLIQL